MLFKKAFIVLGSILVVSTQAYAFSVTGLVGMNYYNPSYSATAAGASSSGKLSYGLGALVSLPVMPLFEVESGAFYRSNKFDVTWSSGGTKLADISYGMNALEIPAILRFTGLPIVSFGAGLFYELGVGSVSETNNLTNASKNASYSDANIKKSNYGIILDARATYPIIPLFKGVLDVRYDFGLRDLSTDSTIGSIKSRNLMVLVGASFDL